MVKKIHIILLSISTLFAIEGRAQESKLWKQFVQAQETGEVSTLPDFSYAGYHHGEKAVPKSTAKIFNVVDYGAVPDDGKSDRIAIEMAIKMAQKNGSGVIYFPKGRFNVNEKSDPKKEILISGGGIIFRGAGSGEGGTELYMDTPMPPKDPKKIYSSPAMFKFSGKGKEAKLTDVVADSQEGSKSVTVANSKGIKKGDWICLKIEDNSKDLVLDELAPCCAEKEWTNILKSGVKVKEYHQVVKVKGDKIIFKEPILREVDSKYKWEIWSYAYSKEVGVEDIAFVGNWKSGFKHHRSWLDDGGYTALSLSRLVNSWVVNCRFTDLNRAMSTGQSANISILNSTVTGTPGHSSISIHASSRVLVGGIDDSSSQWHAPGVASLSIGTVFWNVRYNSDTSFESHASQPRATLFDCTEGGFFSGRAGGARFNLPNHLRHLVLWNYNETDEAEENFKFWASDTWYWKIIPPIVVGFHGSGTTFQEDQIEVIESLGVKVSPASLYEAQLELRMKKLPEWLVDLKNDQK